MPLPPTTTPVEENKATHRNTELRSGERILRTVFEPLEHIMSEASYPLLPFELLESINIPTFFALASLYRLLSTERSSLIKVYELTHVNICI